MAIRCWPIKTIRNMYTRYHRCNKHTYRPDSPRRNIKRLFYVAVSDAETYCDEKAKGPVFNIIFIFCNINASKSETHKKKHGIEDRSTCLELFRYPPRQLLTINNRNIWTDISCLFHSFWLINCNPLRLYRCLFIFYCDTRK